MEIKTSIYTNDITLQERRNINGFLCGTLNQNLTLYRETPGWRPKPGTEAELKGTCPGYFGILVEWTSFIRV